MDVRSARSLTGLLEWAELVIYVGLAVLLVAIAVVALVNSGWLLVRLVVHWRVTPEIARVFDQILFVLMAVEILNTVRISARAHLLVVEPFLVVGVIASVRRILVITLEAANLTREGVWSTPEAGQVFRSSMTELGLLAAVVLVLVTAIVLLRRYAPVTLEDSKTSQP
jgi:uncharacterized membrane protein (DUF373 family)